MMSDTSGLTSRTPLAFYDPDTQCWRTSQATFLSDLIESLETLPKSGMTQRGSLYGLPTSALLTDASASSSLLPTPTSRDHKGRNQRNDASCLPGALDLLPTPAVNDMGEGKTVEWWEDWIEAQKQKHGNGNGNGRSLAIEASRLGGPTSQPSDDGKPSWVEPPLFPPLTEGSTHDSLSG